MRLKGEEKQELEKLTKQIIDNPHGLRWLELLGKDLFAEDTTAQADMSGRVDALQSIKAEGMRMVPVYIKKLINKKPKTQGDTQNE